MRLLSLFNGIFKRDRIVYCGAIHPYCGYKRKRYRPRIHFPDVNAVDVMSVVVALVASVTFVAAFLRWWFS